MDGMEGNGADTYTYTDTELLENLHKEREILLRNTKKQAKIENPRQIEREGRQTVRYEQAQAGVWIGT